MPESANARLSMLLEMCRSETNLFKISVTNSVGSPSTAWPPANVRDGYLSSSLAVTSGPVLVLCTIRQCTVVAVRQPSGPRNALAT